MIDITNREYERALASAKFLVTDTSFPPYFIKKKEQVYLNTWHGTPLKAMGRIVPSREYALGNVQRNFLIADYLLYQNDFSKEVFLRDYMLENIYPGKILVSGYPRNSALLHGERYHQIRKECGIENKQVIVYMPTWRGLLHQKETEKQLRQLGGFFTEIDSKLSDSQIFYVKLHPFVKDQMDFSGYKHMKEFPQDYETYDFLSASDTLVTDYSSIMFDYGVTRRKIVLFTYDREEYLSGRGLYLNLDSLELPKADTVDELIRELSAEKKDYPQFYEKFCSYDSVNTPKQICDILLYGQTKETEPLKIEKISSAPDRKRYSCLSTD
jgi:CDP-glycerol glycerophosphotransferase (TagB/SpsB family)